MKTLESKITWLVFVIAGSMVLPGCYTVLQKSGYYSEFDDTSETVEMTEDVAEIDTLGTDAADSDNQTIIINRYYDGPWYDNYGYYPYRWTVGLGYGFWPYYYAGYYGWPYVGVYYSPWWNDYYYAGWCYYPRHYYGYYGHGYGHHGRWFDDDYNIRRTYTGRRTTMTGSGGALTGGSYSGTATSVRETSDGSRSSGKALNKNSSRKTGTKKAVRDGQRQTRIKNDGSGQGRGSRDTRGSGRETRRDGGSERGTRKNSDEGSSRRRSTRFSYDSGYAGFGPSGQGNSFQRSASSFGRFNVGHRSGSSGAVEHSSGVRSGQGSRRTGR